MTHTPRAALVYNPVKIDTDAVRGALQTLEAELGWAETLWLETSEEDPGQGPARQALEADVDVVIAAGGDGTVRAVAEALRGTGTALALLPSGTGNLLARNLGLPLGEPETMIEAAFTGDRTPIDVGWARITRAGGEVEQHAFVVMGGMGLDAAMIANTNPQLKKSVGWVAYVDGATRSLVNAKPFRVVYQLDGHRMHAARVQSVLFANCGSLQAGIELIPEASVTDGQLDVVIMQPKGFWGWLLVWRRVAWDNSFLRKFRAGRRVLSLRTKDSAVVYSRGRGVALAPQEPHPVQLDGDEFGEAKHVQTRIDAGGLIVAMPSGHELPQT